MGTPLSMPDYGSRFSLDVTRSISKTEYVYSNMVFHGFYGGTSLQAEELNELQENIQNQISLLNTLSGNWLSYNADGKNENIDAYNDYGNKLIPVDPAGISYNADIETVFAGWFLYTDSSTGYKYYISSPNRTALTESTHIDVVLEKKTIFSNNTVWSSLLGNPSDTSTFDKTGAHRIRIQSTDVVSSKTPPTAEYSQYFSRIAFDGGVTNALEWNQWSNNTIAIFSGKKITSNSSTNVLSRPYGDFSRNPLPSSSPWHNLVYEKTYHTYEWGNRSFLYQFPFGGFRNNKFPIISGTKQEQSGEEGVIANYIKIKENNPVSSNPFLNDWACPARWVGFKEAFNDVIRGTMVPTSPGYTAMNEPSNVVLYLPGFMGWATYREETTAYWDNLPGGFQQKNTTFQNMLDGYIADLVYIQENGDGTKGQLYIGIDSASNSATPQTVHLYQGITGIASVGKLYPATDNPYTQFSYKALKPQVWGVTGGGYRSDIVELADWYVKNKLSEKGIIVLPEIRPKESVSQMQIGPGNIFLKEYGENQNHGVYRTPKGSTGSLTNSYGKNIWDNYSSIESTMWTSRTYTAPDSHYDHILRWPSAGFEVAHENDIGDPTKPGNVYNLPRHIRRKNTSGQIIEKKLITASSPSSTPFYYLHTLNALVDHKKWHESSTNGGTTSDIKLNQKNIITLESFMSKNIQTPLANSSTSDTTSYYMYSSDSASLEDRPSFDINSFLANPEVYNEGYWTSENKSYWDNNIRSDSFSEFLIKLKTISSTVAPPLEYTPDTETITKLATGFTFGSTYPNDEYSKGILDGIVLESRPQVWAFSWHSVTGNIDDWSTDLDNVTLFSHVKPMVWIKNNYNTSPIDDNQLVSVKKQLVQLNIYNNLKNTNIKNININRYAGIWLWGGEGNITDLPEAYDGKRSNMGTILWPDLEMAKAKKDWILVLSILDQNKTDLDGLLIAKTRIVGDMKFTSASSNFQLNFDYYTKLKSDSRYDQQKYGVASLKDQIITDEDEELTWSGEEEPAFCDNQGCGFDTKYIRWNAAVENIIVAAYNEIIWEPFIERYANIPHDFRGSNYGSSVSKDISDGAPDANGHELWHKNLFGNSPSVVLYGTGYPDVVWYIDPDNTSKLKRKVNPNTYASFTWHNNSFNAFLISIQHVRSAKRGLISKNLHLTGVQAWIAPKDLITIEGSSSIGFAESEYWDENIRHAVLNGVEVFGFFNGLHYTTTSLFDKTKRIEQMQVLNDVLVDINNRLGGFTPNTVNHNERIAYDASYVISGAKTIDGEYLWRITPSDETMNITINNIIINKIFPQIGVWYTTHTDTQPTVIISPSTPSEVSAAYSAAIDSLQNDTEEIISRFN